MLLTNENLLTEKTKGILLSQNYMSTRLYNSLRRAGYTYLSEVIIEDIEKISQLRYLGRQCLDEFIDIKNSIIELSKDEISAKFSAEAACVVETEDNVSFNLINVISMTYGCSLNEDDYMCIDANGFEVPDSEIEVNVLSNRTYNALRRKGIRTIRELAIAKYNELTTTSGIGTICLNEAKELLKKRTVIRTSTSVDDSKVNEIEKFIVRIEDVLRPCAIVPFDVETRNRLVNHIASNNLIIKMDNVDIINQIMSCDVMQDLIEKRVYLNVGKDVFDQVTYEAIEANFSTLNVFGEDLLKNIIEGMKRSKKLLCIGDCLYTYKKSVNEWLLDLEGKELIAIKMRCEGCTLEEVGSELGVTRERARQIVSKGLKKKPVLWEDGFKTIFEEYAFSDEEFKTLFDLNQVAINYLKFTCKRIGTRSIYDLLEDGNMPVYYLKRIPDAFKGRFLFYRGNVMPLKREKLMEFIFKYFCSNTDCTIRELERYYYDFLQENDLENNRKLLFPTSHAFEARILDYPNCVSKYGKRVRYLDMSTINIEDLLDKLNLNMYMDMEISTLKLYIDNKEYFEDIGVQDEYELHNILRKNSSKLNKFNVKIGRMPLIVIGAGDRGKQVEELLYQMSPISNYELALEYEVRYGVKKETVLAGFFKEIDVYLSNGIFDVAQSELSKEDYQRLAAALVDDIYLWNEIVSIYTTISDECNFKAINALTLKQMGFRVFSQYVIKNTYASADAYFSNLFLKEPEIWIDTLKPGVRSIQAFYACLYNLRDDLTLIEVDKNHYVRFDYFIKKYFECTKAELHSIGERIINSKPDDIFTIKEADIDEVINPYVQCFNSIYFINSLARTVHGVRTSIVNNICIIAKNGKESSQPEILLEILRNKGSLTIPQIISIASKQYSLNIERSKVVYYLKESKQVNIDEYSGFVTLESQVLQYECGTNFWEGTAYEKVIQDNRAAIEMSLATIAGIYWKERYRTFVDKCTELSIMHMKKLLVIDVEKMCMDLGMDECEITDIINCYFLWVEELLNNNEDNEDILNMFFK